MTKIETTCKVSLKLTSMINLRRQGTRIPSSRLWTQSTSPPPPTRKGHARSKRNHPPTPPPHQKTPPPPPPPPPPLILPTGLQKRPQMAITDHIQNQNHKQSATETYQQHKPWKVRCKHAPIP